MDNNEQNKGQGPENIPSSQQGFEWNTPSSQQGLPSSQYFDKRDIRPTSVTVFGVLNCVFGGLGLICTPCLILASLYYASQKAEVMTQFDKMYSIFSGIVSVFLSIWEIFVGAALLRFIARARRSAVTYATVAIVWVILSICVNIYYMSTGQLKPPASTMPGYDVGFYIGQSCGMFIPIIYPILLLVFMCTARVKEAFRLIGE